MITKRRKHRDIDCRICQNGCGHLRKIWWNQDRHLLDVTAKILQNHLVWNLFHQRHYKRSTMYESTFSKTQMMRFASVRKLQGQLADVIHKSHTLRATKFCDLVTADHQVFCAEGESRSDQRCALVMQDLATHWIQSYPCKTQTSEQTTRNLLKFLDPGEKPKGHIR